MCGHVDRTSVGVITDDVVASVDDANALDGRWRDWPGKFAVEGTLSGIVV